MSRYSDIQSHERFGKLTKVSDDKLRALATECPGVPKDYSEFLAVVGAGDVGAGSFMLYDGLVPPTDIYGAESSGPLNGLWILGDDFQGYSVGFAPEDGWAVVEIDPMDKSYEVVASTFEQFVRENLL